MKLGFSLNAFSKKTIPYAIQSLSKIGYDGIELVVDWPHMFLPINSDEINRIKHTLDEWNLQVTNLNSNTVLGYHKKPDEKFEPSLSNPNEKLRQWRMEFTKKAIDLAESWESPSISITSGVFNQNNSKEEHLLFEESLMILGEYSEKRNTQIAIEYEPGLLIENSAQVFDLISRDFKNIGLNLDTCHAGVLGEDLDMIISRFGSKIIHTHISDCKNNKHYHLLPGLGEIDFSKMYDSLRKINYSGFLTAELYPYWKDPDDAASKTFIYFKNLIK